MMRGLPSIDVADALLDERREADDCFMTKLALQGTYGGAVVLSC